MPSVIVNPNSGLAESYDDPQQAHALLGQGYHLPLHDAQGNSFSAPLDEATQLVQSGQYRQPSTEELDGWLNTAKYQGSPFEHAKSFIEGAARALTGGLSTEVEVGMGVPRENIQARSELLPGSAALGEMSAITAATIASEGFFGPVAARMASGTLPGFINRAAGAAASGIEISGTFGNLARGLTQGSIESGLLQANHELGEHLVGNGDIFSQHAMANIGIAALLGGGVGGALGAGFGPFSMIAKNAERLSDTLGKVGKGAARESMFSTADLWSALKKQAGELNVGDYIHMFTSPKTFAASQIAKLASKFSAEELKRIFPHAAMKAGAILGTYKMGLNTLSRIESQSAGLFGFGAFDATKSTEDRKEMDALYERTNEIQMNPESLANHLQHIIQPIGEHMPNTVISLSQAAAHAAVALSTQKPNLQKSAPLDKDKKPSPNDIARFNRASELLNKPLSIFPKIKDGSVAEHDLLLLKSVYPSVLQSIQKETMKNLIRHQAEKDSAPLPIQTRLGLSRLFAQNMDSSLTHLSKNQMTLAGMGVAQAMQQQSQARPSKSGMGRMKSGTRDQTMAQAAAERKRA